MGQVIPLPRKSAFAGDHEVPTPEALHELSNDELQQAIEICAEVRRQIGLLLEFTAQAEKAIDEIPDVGLKRLLREKRAYSHIQLISALARMSTTIAALTKAASARALLAVAAMEGRSSNERSRD